MLNLKSFELFVDEYKSTLKVHNRLNEGLGSSNLYGNISKITDKKCLVINDYLLAMDLEDRGNDVYCLFYDNDTEIIKDLMKNKKYCFINLEQNMKDIKKNISQVFDKVWKLDRNFRFDYVINISPNIQPKLQYKAIADLESFIFCYPFIDINGKKLPKDESEGKTIVFRKGYTVYYSFDENHVMGEFDRIIYDFRNITSQNERKITQKEWADFGYNDKTTRYFVVVFVDPNEYGDVINNRNKESVNLDEEDFSNDENIGRDDEHPFTGMAEPKIYAFSSKYVNDTLKNRSKGDSIKVGDTNRTVSKRLAEWKQKFSDLVRLKSWDAIISGCGEGIDGKVFRDYTIHKLLTSEVNRLYHNEGKKIEQVDINEFTEEDRKNSRYSREFFRNCTTEDVDHAIEILKDRCKESRSTFLNELNDNSEKENSIILPLPDNERKLGSFVDRDIQKKTIDEFNKAIKKGKKNLLMYAVMRFGKTYVACRCNQEMKTNKFTVIVTAKPGVRNEWTETVNVHKEFAGYDMYDADTLNEVIHKWAEGKTEPTLKNYLEGNKDRHIMLFTSLHDLFGDTKSKDKTTMKPEVKEKHKCFDKYPVDLLIIDEAHYGTQTGNFGFVIGETENARLKEVMKSLNLDNAVKLYLSGTPYDLLLDSKFNDDEIISTYGFMDIIEAKNQWDDKYRNIIENHLTVTDEKDPNKGKELTWEDNPYFGTPEMLEYGYNLQDFNLSDYSDNYDTEFADLFKCHKDESGKFVFDNADDVKKIFEILDGTKSETGIVSFLDVDEIKKGNMCKHIVITLPSTASCDALEDLLIDNRDTFANFGEYKIIKASTADKADIDTEKVKKLINTYIKSGNKTITLTCDRLLTGVTIKPWDTMFFMKDCASPQEYDQAKFRIMTPYVKNTKSVDVDDEGNIVKGEKTKINMKPQVLFVDFHPDRIVDMKVRRYEAEAAAEGRDDYSTAEFIKKVEKEKGSITLLLLKDGKFVSGSSVDVGKMVLDMREKRAVEMTMDQVLNETDKISDPSEKEIEFMLLEHNIRKTAKDGTTSKGEKVHLRGGLEKTDKPSGLEPGEKKETRTERLKKMKEEDPESFKNLVKLCKQGRKTIVKDILMYILLKNRGVKAKTGETEDDNISTIDKFADIRDSFNHYTGFDRPKVKTAKIEDIPDQMKENDKIICSIFCEDLGIPEPDYENPYKVSETVESILELIDAWWSIISKNRHDKHIVLQSWSNMQLKYKKLEKEGKSNFESLRNVLSKYTRLGETEVVTPEALCPKLFENVVIFNKNDFAVLDCYCGKIGEVFNRYMNDEHFKNISKLKKINGYYMICRTRTIAELNFFVVKNYMKGLEGFGTHAARRKWFNEHILVYDPSKVVVEETPEDEEKREVEFSDFVRERGQEEIEEGFERFETFSEFMKLLKEGKYSDEEIKERKRKKEEKKWVKEGGLIELKEAIENKWKDKFKGMIQFDCIVGNPPYGSRTSSIHLQIFKTVLDFCKGKLCFIMPSKPIVQQLKPKWYDVFKNAVCTDITVVDKSMFPTTVMDNTAIYYCDRNVSNSKYCKKLDVDVAMYNAIDNNGHKLFIDKMGAFTKKNGQVGVLIDWDRRKKDKYPAMLSDGKWYLIVNRAHGTFGGQWISSELAKVGILSKEEATDFVINDIDVKNIIECPSEKYGLNLKSLMFKGLVLRYGLWLTQIAQGITTPQFKYVPGVDYENIDTDEKLLDACDFTPDEIKTVMDYLKDFNFSQNRNEIVRNYTGVEVEVDDED